MADKMVIPGPDGGPEGGEPAGEESGGEPAGGAAAQVNTEQSEYLNWDLLFDFHAMIEELKATDGVVDVNARMYDPVPGFTIETIEHGLGIRVPPHIKSFYQVTDGLEFSWSYEDDDGQTRPGGGAHLFDFASVFDNWLDLLWRSEEHHSEEQQDFFWSLRGFDRHTRPTPSESDPSEIVVMCVEEEYPTYDLFIHDLESRQSHLLELSFREYFDCLLTSRGTYGWRRLLSEAPEADEHAERFFEVVERFFPDADVQRWRR